MSDSWGKFLDGKKNSELVISKLRHQKAKVNFILTLDPTWDGLVLVGEEKGSPRDTRADNYNIRV
jgi:hypothetical protein